MCVGSTHTYIHVSVGLLYDRLGVSCSLGPLVCDVVVIWKQDISEDHDGPLRMPLLEGMARDTPQIMPTASPHTRPGYCFTTCQSTMSVYVCR